MGWFGDLDLAYKYSTVFGALLLLTILAGFCKVLYNRRRLKNHTKAQQAKNVEAGPSDDEQMELNQREKDEGDLFGIRAIEAGFYAGIPQSRPVSRAGSFVGGPTMSSNALIGSLNALKMNTNSMASSVTSLPLAHTSGGYRDSEVLPDSPPRRKGAPTITLGPSEAELNGRINHNAQVDMGLNVPPSPVFNRNPRSPTFNSSDSDDGRNSPSALMPHSGNSRQDYYAPAPPQLPMPEFKDNRDESQPHTSFPSYTERRSSLPKNDPRDVGAGQSQSNNYQPSPNSLLQSDSHQSTHQRDMSNASSMYSENRMSTIQHQHNRTDSIESGYSYNYSFPEAPKRISVTQAPNTIDQSHRQSVSGGMLAPDSATSNQPSDPRLSEFYDAYYRHSQLLPSAKADASKRPNQLNLSDQTIDEVPTPLASPAVQTAHY